RPHPRTSMYNWTVHEADRVFEILSAADNLVLLHAQPGDAHLDDVAGLEIARRLHAVGDAGRRARRDDVAGAERHEAAHVRHEMTDAEDHVLGVAALADGAGAAPDDAAELDLVVALHAARRPEDGVVRPADRAVGVDEEQRLAGQGQADLARVVRVVEADAHDLADAGERRAQARPA